MLIIFSSCFYRARPRGPGRTLRSRWPVTAATWPCHRVWPSPTAPSTTARRAGWAAARRAAGPTSGCPTSTRTLSRPTGTTCAPARLRGRDDEDMEAINFDAGLRLRCVMLSVFTAAELSYSLSLEGTFSTYFDVLHYL